jgi:hypothetical protein
MNELTIFEKEMHREREKYYFERKEELYVRSQR